MWVITSVNERDPVKDTVLEDDGVAVIDGSDQLHDGLRVVVTELVRVDTDKVGVLVSVVLDDVTDMVDAVGDTEELQLGDRVPDVLGL